MARAHKDTSVFSPPAHPHEGAPRLMIDKEVLECTEAPFIEMVKGCCPPSLVLAKKSLNPGERTTVSVSFMLYQGMGGLHDFRVYLRTNDPSQPDKTVQILAGWK